MREIVFAPFGFAFDEHIALAFYTPNIYDLTIADLEQRVHTETGVSLHDISVTVPQPYRTDRTATLKNCGFDQIFWHFELVLHGVCPDTHPEVFQFLGKSAKRLASYDEVVLVTSLYFAARLVENPTKTFAFSHRYCMLNMPCQFSYDKDTIALNACYPKATQKTAHFELWQGLAQLGSAFWFIVHCWGDAPPFKHNLEHSPLHTNLVLAAFGNDDQPLMNFARYIIISSGKCYLHITRSQLDALRMYAYTVLVNNIPQAVWQDKLHESLVCKTAQVLLIQKGLALKDMEELHTLAENIQDQITRNKRNRMRCWYNTLLPTLFKQMEDQFNSFATP